MEGEAMMTQAKALDKLIAAVEAGDIDGMTPHCDLPAMHVLGAYCGSLDAAKALHEALLPGWGWETGINATFSSIAQVWKSGREKAYSATAQDPACAWLIAILKAYRAGL